MNVTTVNPVWGNTLKAGYCGFITRERDFVGDGIAWFSRWQTGLPFVHAFAVTGAPESGRPEDTQIIEAHAGRGVSRNTIGQYLGKSNCQCFIRPPFGYTEQIGAQVVSGMVSQLGDSYSYGLIVADALANSYAGHLLNSWTLNIPDRIVCGLFTDAHHRICSQAVASALQVLMYLRLRGCLRLPAATITPAQLGNDNQVFDPIIYRLAND